MNFQSHFENIELALAAQGQNEDLNSAWFEDKFRSNRYCCENVAGAISVFQMIEVSLNILSTCEHVTV